MTVYIVGEALPNDETYIAGVFDNHAEARRLSVELSLAQPMVYCVSPREVFSTREEFYAYQIAEEEKLKAES